MSIDYAAGASSARNKLATFFRGNGIRVETSKFGSPPTDDDFLRSLLALVREQSNNSMKSPDTLCSSGGPPYTQYTIPVPLPILNVLSQNRKERRTLFTARGRRGFTYIHTFYLAADESGIVRVYHSVDCGPGRTDNGATIVMPERAKGRTS